MTRAEWQRANKDKEPLDWKPYWNARRHFSVCKAKGVVLHHKIIGCTNYEEWNVDELVPMFKWCHAHFHLKGNPGRMLGKKHSEDTLAKMSTARKGKMPSNLAMLHSPEMVEKRASVQRGKMPANLTILHSAECIKKRAESQKGHITTEETRKKISDSLMGHGFSEETRRKMSESQKKRFAKIA